MHYEVYTDGTYKNGTGAWSFLIFKNGQLFQQAAGRVKKTTCNRMEMQAAIEALRHLPENVEVELFTDSRVLIEAATVKIDVWADLHWLKKNGRPIPDVDQMKQIFQLKRFKVIRWIWVRAHSGNVWNERCDQLCRQTRDSGN